MLSSIVPSSWIIGALIIAGAGVGTELVRLSARSVWQRGVDPALDRISGARRTRKDIQFKLAKIAAEFEPNRGTSLVDRLTALEDQYTTIEADVDRIQSSLDEVGGHVSQILEIVTSP